MTPKSRVPIFRPKLPMTQELLPYLQRIDNSQSYTNHGELVCEFEELIARFLGLPPSCVVLVANATLAIEGAIQTSQNQSNSWIVPSWTFAATAHALRNSGCEFAFGDIAQDWRLDLGALKNDDYALLDVVPFGDCIDLNRYMHLSSKVVVDAAVSLPLAKHIGTKLSPDVALVFSLHATKPISSGEGGIFCSSDVDWVARVRSWTRFGFSSTRIASSSGTNAKMSEYSAAVGIASFRAWPENEKKWIELSLWAKQLSERMGLKVQPSLHDNNLSPYWIIWSESRSRIELICAAMAQEGIETRRWWESGCHRMPLFSKVPLLGDLSNTDYFANRSIALPYFIDLTKEEKLFIESAFVKS